MNAHEKLQVVMDRIRPIFYNNGFGEIYDYLEIWLVDKDEYVASINGRRISIKTYIAWILQEGGLAFLIGHEAFHFINSVRGQVPNLLKETIDFVDNSDLSSWGKILMMFLGAAISIPASRIISQSEEIKADFFGKKIALEAGYPLSHIEHLFSIWEFQRGGRGGFFDTHPDTRERKEKLELGRYF